jgi:23S rRNA-/tRNA-specific pseudouridylate synthase
MIHPSTVGDTSTDVGVPTDGSPPSGEDAQGHRPTPPPPRFDIIHMSEELVVVDKPFDVAMDGADRTDMTVEKWVHSALRPFLETPLSAAAAELNGALGSQKAFKIVHQLDYATSGTLCLAFSRDMAARLAHCFRERQTKKEYLALLWGWVDAAAVVARQCGASSPGIGIVVTATAGDDAAGNKGDESLRLLHIEAPIGQDPSDPTGFRMVIGGTDARDASSDITVLAHGYVRVTAPTDNCASGAASPVVEGSSPAIPQPSHGGERWARCTKVRLRLYTGRRHQLRLHSALIGHPIVGDVTYEGGTPIHVVRSLETTPSALGAAIQQVDSSPSSLTANAVTVPRMMLHSWKIAFHTDVFAAQAMSLKDRKLDQRKRRRETKGLPAQPSGGGDDDDGAEPSTPAKSSTFESRDALEPYFVTGSVS